LCYEVNIIRVPVEVDDLPDGREAMQPYTR
jgi:hypothetical protein